MRSCERRESLFILLDKYTVIAFYSNNNIRHYGKPLLAYVALVASLHALSLFGTYAISN